MYYCIKDNQTGNSARISLFDMFWLKVALVVSLVVYGIVVGTVLTLVGVPYMTLLWILVAIYAFELVGWFMGKTTPGKVLMAFIVLLKWKSVFEELQIGKQSTGGPLNKEEIAEALSLCSSFEHFSRNKNNTCL